MKNSSFRFTIRIGATGKTVEDAKSGVYDITDAEGEDFCFSGTGACDNHDGAFDGVNGEALVGVEGV